MNKLIIIGAGGHSKVIQEIVKASNKYNIYAILDDNFNETITESNIIYSNLNYIKKLHTSEYFYVIAIGNNQIRKKIVAELGISDEYYATIIHPSAAISESSEVMSGTVIMQNSIVNANSIVENHCIINTSTIVEHDNYLKSFVHISPGTILSGGVSVDEETHIGSGSVVIPGIKIGSSSVIGAGTVVTKDIPNHVTAVGVPARIVKGGSYAT